MDQRITDRAITHRATIGDRAATATTDVRIGVTATGVAAIGATAKIVQAYFPLGLCRNARATAVPAGGSSLACRSRKNRRETLTNTSNRVDVRSAVIVIVEITRGNQSLEIPLQPGDKVEVLQSLF
jgi:hypothetical protein